MAEVKFDTYGFIYVNVYFRSRYKPDMKPFSYKVDTGANLSTINRSVLHRLGFDDDWIKSGRLLTGSERPTVATGKKIDDCYIVALPEITIADFVGYNWPFLTSLSAKFRFLMGTDSMRFFNWNLDYARNTCEFELIPNKRELLFDSKEQSIHTIDEVEGFHL